MTNTRETDLRLAILNTLLTTPHRNLAAVWQVHRELIAQDPRFYVRLAAWYFDHGDVRDHQEAFIISLVLSAFEGHRDVGLALLRTLPPYQVVRVVDFINGRKKLVNVRTEDAQGRVEYEPILDEIGLFRNPPRSLRTEVTRYLREREADGDWFDSSVLTARKALKRLYALLHVRPGERAQRILFDEDPPADSRLFALRLLAKAKTPAEQAAAIIEHRIPYRVAATVVQQMTPTVLFALVNRMTSQEVINNLGALQRRGALDNPELKALIDHKLEQAQHAQRVSAFKAEEALKTVPVSDDVRRKLEKVADTQVKAKGRIARPTALLIDKSGSMDLAIELGKRIGAMVSALCAEKLYVYAFDTIAYPIEPALGDMGDPGDMTDLAGWEKALAGITAGGGTSCGVALEFLIRKQQYVEQLVLVTDEGENTPPLFVDSLRKYKEAVKADPSVIFVKTPGASAHLEDQCRAAGILADAFQFTGDYYALPNLAPLLSRPSKLELLMEIMEYPLPRRKAA
jgi:hypothetical protein